jgi:hypothetical protein
VALDSVLVLAAGVAAGAGADDVSPDGAVVVVSLVVEPGAEVVLAPRLSFL